MPLESGISEAKTLDPDIIHESVRSYNWSNYGKQFFAEQVEIPSYLYPLM